MTKRRALIAALATVLLAINAIISFGITEWRMDTVEGPRGEQGPIGPQGQAASQTVILGQGQFAASYRSAISIR